MSAANPPREVQLDVCGLEPPEPLERVLEALSALQPDQQLRMLIDRMPMPLFQILTRNGYLYETLERPDFLVEIVIRQKS